MMRNQNAGFTLIELMIVIVLLAVLAAIVIPRIRNPLNAAELSSVGSQLQTVRGQIELFRAENAGRPPDFSRQWEEILEQGFLREAPVNAHTNSTVVIAGTSPDDAGADDGWVWDAADRHLYAAFLDEEQGLWTGP